LVFEKIRDILAEQFSMEPEDITVDTDLEADLNADSLDVAELIMAIEEEFDIVIEDEQVEGVRTVGDIVNALNLKK